MRSPSELRRLILEARDCRARAAVIRSEAIAAAERAAEARALAREATFRAAELRARPRMQAVESGRDTVAQRE
jgi:hypothetical protein